MPNANAVSALNLLRLHRLTRRDAHLDRALGIFGASSVLMKGQPSAFSQMLIALDFYLGPPFEAVVTGERSSAASIRAVEALYRRFAPSLVLAAAADDAGPMAQGKPPQGEGLVYLCRDTVCGAPTADADALIAALDDVSRYSLDE
jgi:uncharacterized protein YyaL (SSP411 family)